ncbi:hypothetical protein F383_15098 [Gossypium arboreum]|uniref:Uncharacterized protein n=1 Tax=Gossypium arboreum TaxID=29729 RepID=A0A0B0PYX5_GOSAR|nr:hypothetical protein F383_15098 [Gossypium arboreum]
MPKKKNTERR